jgi:hypothetical protein
MRTHKDKLQALLHYLELNTLIVTYRLRAEHFYNMDDEVTSWEYLFRWVKAKDQRAQMWTWFQDEYPDAVILKEGYYESR